MEEKVTKCLETIGKAFKELIISANNEAEAVGLITLVLGSFRETYEKAVEEGIDELVKREEEETVNGIQ
jgi:hypothetical protein